MKIALNADEQVIRKGYANHFESHIRMTGKLYLTNERLFFVTHPLNFKHYELSIPLDNITGVRLKNNIKFFPHGFVLTLKNGQEHNFVTWRRKHWAAEIEAHL